MCIRDSNIVVEIESDTSDESVTKPFAVYLSGIDTNGDITEQGRSDVNIVAVVNPTSHQVLLITTPRDYYVPIPGVSGGQDDKLTHAGIYGVDVSMPVSYTHLALSTQFYRQSRLDSIHWHPFPV